ncbi:Splicing factor U2af large subunit A [Acorus calamus]|uniref:Splicing factor U2af large subunit n=1 Tax=Acorus calamus TaxID=4465 RepID=A0AAV9EX32_ACOCL|nr:Splicing factor U2af large subunit A [Acorus calamus]
MPDYSGRYDRNGEGFSERNGLDDYGGGDSVTQHESHDHERVSSRSREKDRDKDHARGSSRTREKDRDKDKDHERDSSRSREKDRYRDKDHERGSSRSREKDRDKYRDRDREHDKDHDRHHRDRHRDRSDREGRHRHRSRSPSRSKSEHRSRERSRSRSSSKSKRISGFDMAPPQPTMLPGVAAAGQMTGTTALPGMLPNMFPMVSTQFGALPIMPVQAMTQQATRHARRVYVGGLSPTANEQSVATFFSQVMSAIGGNTAGPGDAVVNVYINHEKKFAFVEMRSVEEASNAMALDGIIFEGAPVKVRRPSDYNPSLASALGPSIPSPNLNLAAVGLTPGSAGGLEGPDRIFVGGLPYYFTEAQIRELLESFGPLRGFDLVKDRETGNSKGYAFCVYQDLSVTDIACAALNGIKMGDKTLTVRRANQGATQPRPEQESVLLQAQQQVALQRLVFQAGSLPTKIICLTQVVSADELKDDDEYEDILDDMREEGRKFGNLVNVVIPRPNPNGEPTPGVGKVYLEYADTDGAMKARQGLNGRKFGGNTVVAVFYPENKYAEGVYDN